VQEVAPVVEVKDPAAQGLHCVSTVSVQTAV
jgi:hypothetical protein